MPQQRSGPLVCPSCGFVVHSDVIYNGQLCSCPECRCAFRAPDTSVDVEKLTKMMIIFVVSMVAIVIAFFGALLLADKWNIRF